MDEKTIKCPSCGNVIEISEAFSKEVEEKLRNEFNQRYKEEKVKLEGKIKKQAEEDLAVKLKDLQDADADKTEKLREARDKELLWIKKQRDFEEREQNYKLELERMLTEERNKIRTETTSKVAEEYRLRNAEKDKTISDLAKQLDDAKRRAEQGSQQSQGEIFELELENILRSAFRYDDIEPVPKGIKGADVIQRVKNQNGSDCGAILWESKRTKSWSDQWILALKDDQREAKADVAVIVSTVLPKNVTHIGHSDGVWIVDFPLAVGLAAVLREGIIKVAQAQNALVGKNEKMELVYSYLSGPQFTQRVEAILRTFVNMKNDLESEKRAMEKIWAKREKQIDRIQKNTSSMYGEIEGIIGKALPPIATLELPMSDDDE